MSPRIWTVVALMAAAPTAATAQRLAESVRDLGTGTLRFSYATRPAVVICDDNIYIGDDHVGWNDSGRDHGTNCRNGPARVELEVRDGRVRNVELVRRRTSLTQGAVDLGEVSAPRAARYLLSLGRTAPGHPGEHAIFAAVLADVDGVWRDLLDIARDRTAPRDARKGALFWVGQEAADSVTRGLADVASDEDEDQSVRDAAIFALSQRSGPEAVPVLMDLARTARQAKTRRTAMFWLAQSEDPRVPVFFENILVKGGGG